MTVDSNVGKGSKRRPPSPHVSREERDLRWALSRGEITRKEFDKQLRELKNDNV